ncbi:MAG: hypothetical protein LBT09_11085 [Planctomycetaceae bacterium]|nr:hypothetical protein [Planctomycetaceae bacterium]
MSAAKGGQVVAKAVADMTAAYKGQVKSAKRLDRINKIFRIDKLENL